MLMLNFFAKRYSFNTKYVLNESSKQLLFCSYQNLVDRNKPDVQDIGNFYWLGN